MPSSRSPRTNAFPTVQTGLGIGRSSRCNCTILVNLRLLLILLWQTHIRSLCHRGRQIVFSIDPEPQLLILLLFYINKDAGECPPSCVFLWGGRRGGGPHYIKITFNSNCTSAVIRTIFGQSLLISQGLVCWWNPVSLIVCCWLGKCGRISGGGYVNPFVRFVCFACPFHTPPHLL